MSIVFCSPYDGDERTEARAFLLAEQDLVQHVEPVEHDAGLAVLGLDLAGLVEKRLAPPDLVDDFLNAFGRLIRRQLSERVAQIDQRRALRGRRLAELLFRQHEVSEVVDRIVDQLPELGMRCGRNPRPVTRNEAPQRLCILGIRRRDKTEQHRKRDRHLGRRRRTRVNVPDRIGQALTHVLALIRFQELLILVGMTRDYVEVQPFRRLRLAIHEQRQAFRAGVAQPLLDGQAVALRL